jgi:hypothetical protein
MNLPIKLVLEPHVLENAFLNGDEKCRELVHEIRDTLYCISKKPAPPLKLQKARIFLSYKSFEMDRKWVEDIEESLTDEGHNVWYNRKSLSEGSEWESELYKEIESRDFFIIFLSAASVNSKGWHNVELKRALLEQDKYPLGTTYIIPVMLTENALPENLRRFNALSIYLDAQLGLEKLGQAIMIEMSRRNSRDESCEKKEFVYVCEDKESGESKVYKRYKNKLSISEDFLDWYDKLKNAYKALHPVMGGLMQKHKTELRSYRCREEVDEIFIDLAHRAPGILVSQCGESGVCLNGHGIDTCDTVEYLRSRLQDQVFSVDDALSFLQNFKKEWCACT